MPLSTLRHSRLDCRATIPAATFESLKRVWPAPFARADGRPVVTVECPGCLSCIDAEAFDAVPASET